MQLSIPPKSESFTEEGVQDLVIDLVFFSAFRLAFSSSLSLLDRFFALFSSLSSSASVFFG